MIGTVLDRIRSLIALLVQGHIGLVQQLVEVPLLQVMGFEKTDIVVLHDETESLKVAVIGIGLLGGGGHIPPMGEMSKRSRNVVRIPNPEVYPLIESIGQCQSVLEALAGGESLPFFWIRVSLLIPDGDVRPSVKLKTHRSLASPLIASIRPAGAIGDVVVDDTVVNKRPVPIVIKTRKETLIDLLATLVGYAVCPVTALGDELIHWQRLECGRGRAGVIGHAVVNIAGKIRCRIVCIRNANAAAQRVGHRDAVAKERAMGLCRDHGSKDPITCQHIPTSSGIRHRHRRPVRRQFKVRIERPRLARDVVSAGYVREVAGNIVAGSNHLIAEDDGSHALGVRHFGRDHDGVCGSGLLGRVLHLADRRRRVRRELQIHESRRRGVGRRTGRRKHRRPPTRAERTIK